MKPPAFLKREAKHLRQKHAAGKAQDGKQVFERVVKTAIKHVDAKQNEVPGLGVCKHAAAEHLCISVH